MSKYIIELDDNVQIITCIGVSTHGTIWVKGYDVDNLEELNNEHFGELQDEAYQRGLEDAWEAARKIIRMPDGDILDLFPDCYASVCTAVQAILKYDASEAIAKLKAYDDNHSDRIEVGDEVIWSDGTTIIVTMTYVDGGFEWCDGVNQNGRAYHVLLGKVRKTGKHYDIASILEAMRT